MSVVRTYQLRQVDQDPCGRRQFLFNFERLELDVHSSGAGTGSGSGSSSNSSLNGGYSEAKGWDVRLRRVMILNGTKEALCLNTGLGEI